jgi:pyruvate/2-oxoacid:ferredoxin oxidoreductase beta subunit
MPSAAGVATGMKRGLIIREKKAINVVGFAGDGATVDIGLTSLSGAAERGEPVIWLCYDNEAYMNTGIQRSGSTPLGAWTTTTPISLLVKGKQTERKNMPLIMALHRIPYVATASLAYIADLRKKIRKASDVTLQGKGMAYIHVQSPCPPGWRLSPEKTIESARLAVLAGAWPLFEIEGDSLRIDVKPAALKPIDQYLKIQGRFSHLNRYQIEKIQDAVNESWRKLLWLEKNFQNFPL